RVGRRRRSDIVRGGFRLRRSLLRGWGRRVRKRTRRITIPLGRRRARGRNAFALRVPELSVHVERKTDGEDQCRGERKRRPPARGTPLGPNLARSRIEDRPVERG